MNKKKKPDGEKGISITLTIGVVIAVALVGGAILSSGLMRVKNGGTIN